MAARLDQNQEEKSSRRKERLKIQTRGGTGGGSGALIIGCCALIAAGIGAAFAARRARGRGGGSGGRGTRDLVLSVDSKEGREDSRGEIKVDCLVGDQLEDLDDHRDGIVQELSLGGVEEEDGMSQFDFEIKQKLEGSETARVEEVPFTELHEEEETESSSTEGLDEGSEGAGDTSVESNEEQAWRAELSLGRVEESEITCVDGPDQEEAGSGDLETTHAEGMDRGEGVPSIKLREGEAESSSSSSSEGEEGSEGTGDSSVESNTAQVWPAEGNEEEMKQIQVPHADQLQGYPCDDDSLTESEIVEETEEMPMIARQGQKDASDLEMVVESLASLATIAKNSEVVTDTKKNEVEANMDDAGAPVEEGTYMEHNLVDLEEENVRGEDDRMNVSVSVNDIEDMFALTENEERDCQNTEMDSETLGTQIISKNTEVVMELGADIDNGDDFRGQYKQDMEKSEITNMEENQELLEEFGEEESELLTELGRGIIEGSGVIQGSSVEWSPLRTDDMVGIAQAGEEPRVEDLEVIRDSSSLESSAEEMSPGQEEELPSIDLKKIEQLETPTMTDDMVGMAQDEGQVVEDLEVIEDSSSLESSTEETFPEKEKELPSIDLEKIEQVETTMRNNDMVGIAQAEKEQKLEDLEVIQDSSSFESSVEETFPEKEKELPSIDLEKIEQVETQKRKEDQKIEDSEVIQGSPMESSAEEAFPEKEKVLPSIIDLEVETPKRTDDMVGIERAEEEHNLEDSEVTQDSSWESNSQEKEFPSIDLKKIEQVETSKKTEKIVTARGERMDAMLASSFSSFRVFTLLLLAMGLIALGLLAFAQPDSLYRSNSHLPELYHKLSQLLFASYQRAVGDI